MAKLKEGEAYGELLIRLGDLFDKWMIECKSIVDVKEKVVVEQLVSGMPRDLRVWVAERKPTTADMAAELADDYVQAHRREWKLLRDEGQWGGQKKTLDARKCHTCGEAGHLARNCKKDTTNGKDKEDKSTTEKQGSGSGPQKKDKATVKCYNCGQLGHFANRCPSNALLCHDGTHGVQPMKQCGLVEGQAVKDIVLDTGCSQTMVHDALVPKEKRITGEGAVIQCAHGDTVLYLMAQVSGWGVSISVSSCRRGLTSLGAVGDRRTGAWHATQQRSRQSVGKTAGRSGLRGHKGTGKESRGRGSNSGGEGAAVGSSTKSLGL